jgi:hypothetical protein
MVFCLERDATATNLTLTLTLTLTTIRFVAGHLADGERRGLEHGLLLGA